MKQENGQRIFDPQPLIRGIARLHLSPNDLAATVEADVRTVTKALNGQAINMTTFAAICKTLRVTGIRFLE
jgi:DNA-binding Xre family transcriptional regulator